MTRRRKAGRAVALLLAATLAALHISCGGGGGGSSPPPPPPSPLTITTPSALPEATFSLNYTHTLQASGGRAPYTWRLALGSLPQDLTLSGGGLLAGPVASTGDFAFTIEVRDSVGSSATQAMTLRIGTLPRITPPNFPTATLGFPFSHNLAATGGSPPYAWALASGSSPLPPGLSIASSGVVSGTPTAAGTFQFRIEVRDVMARVVTEQTGMVVVAQLSVVTSSLPSGRMGLDYFTVVQAAGGQPPYLWLLAPDSAPLPPGLMVQGPQLQGVPTAAGAFPITFQVQDYVGSKATSTLTVQIADGPVITTRDFRWIITGQPFQYTLQATGGTLPYTWAIAPNPVFQPPAGVTLTPSGVVSGSIFNVSFGNFILDVQLTDGAGLTTRTTVNFGVVAPLIMIPGRLTDGNVGLSYFQWNNLYTGGYSVIVRLAQGSLPPGLSLESPGFFTGRPTMPGLFEFVLEARDFTGQVATGTFSIQVNNFLTITTIQPDIRVGVASRTYENTFSAVAGTLPYTWGIAAGSLPQGLTLDAATGRASGIPAQGGTFAFEIQVTDSSTPVQTVSKNLAITVRPELTIETNTLPDGVINSSYFALIRAVGGNPPPYAARLAAGALPTGLLLTSASDNQGLMVIHEAPLATGTSQFTVEVTDTSSPPFVVTKSFSIRVNPLLVFDSPNPLPGGLEGQPYVFTFTGSGGVPPYTWSGQFLPPGLILDPATGVLSGTPSQEFGGNFMVTLADSSSPPQQIQRTFSPGILGKLRIATTSLPPITRGIPVRLFPFLTGGTCCTFRWSLAAGSLPPGIQLVDSISGELSGVPTAEGAFNFTLRLVDGGTGAFAQSAEMPFQWVVSPPGQLGRNDTPATATPLSNGFYRATISPLSDPPGVALNPDNDYYRVTANGGAVVTVRVDTATVLPELESYMDPVLEFVDANGVRLQTCTADGNDSTIFNSPCMNDDYSSTDSRLVIRVPGDSGTVTVFFARVLDWSGSARPDFKYNIQLRGAN